MIIIKSKQEIERMKPAAVIVATILDEIANMIKPGVTTLEIDQFAEEFIRSQKGKPAFKGYKGFPSTICASPNDVIVHGMPDKTPLVEGDIISIDIGVVKDGFYGDSARTYAVGNVDEESKRLIDVTKACLDLAIKAATVGNHLEDISWAVQQHAENNGFSVVREFVGHGIGRELHEDPAVPNFGKPGMGPKLEEGMVLAIEPMINAGVSDVKMDEDGWTARTKDGKRSAHFEHEVAVTKTGPFVLSLAA